MDGVRSLLLPRCVTRSRNIHNNSSLSVFHWRGWAVHTCHRSRRPFNMSILSSLSSRLHNKRVPFFCPRVCQRPCQNNPLLLRLRRWRWIWQVSLMTIMVAPLVVFTCQKEKEGNGLAARDTESVSSSSLSRTSGPRREDKFFSFLPSSVLYLCCRVISEPRPFWRKITSIK